MHFEIPMNISHKLLFPMLDRYSQFTISQLTEQSTVEPF